MNAAWWFTWRWGSDCFVAADQTGTTAETAIHEGAITRDQRHKPVPLSILCLSCHDKNYHWQSEKKVENFPLIFSQIKNQKEWQAFLEIVNKWSRSAGRLQYNIPKLIHPIFILEPLLKELKKKTYESFNYLSRKKTAKTDTNY